MEHACALLYFTGSMLFNRSMRQLADENNMYLSQHRLHVGVIRMVSHHLVFLSLMNLSDFLGKK
jgi:DNA polymerase/3'-5' exonuclease PolX